MDTRYFEKRKQIEKYFVPENIIPNSGKIDSSPSGQYQIEINRYATLLKHWDYSRGIVRNIASGEVVADIKRNYSHFWHTWVQHSNGNEYLLCGEDYQGYSVLNLNTGKYQAYFPDSGYKGFGFCWSSVYPSPDGLVLAVDGCYWACPYDLVIYDFHHPDELPYPEIVRVEAAAECDGWFDNDTFLLKKEIDIRKSDGAEYDSLPDYEKEILDNDSTLMGYRVDPIHFNWRNQKQGPASP